MPPLNRTCLGKNPLETICEFFPFKRGPDFERDVPLMPFTTTNTFAIAVVMQFPFEMSNNMATPSISTRQKYTTESTAPCDLAKKYLVGDFRMLVI